MASDEIIQSRGTINARQGAADAGPSQASCSPRIAEALQWMNRDALPLWSSRGRDPGLGFHEQLGPDSLPDGPAFKRVRAQARQSYSFDTAFLLGWSAVDGADAWNFLQAHARRQDGGWSRAVARDGGAFDPAFDLYDTAFVMLAHAQRYRVMSDPAVLEGALATLDAVDKVLGDGRSAGWRCSDDGDGVRHQNPHMHMLEALIALSEATGHERFVRAAAGLVDLFTQRLFDERHGYLPERFDADWRPLPGSSGNLIEPGHVFEWVWLLHRAEPWVGRRLGDYSRALLAFAGTRGVRPGSGLVFDEVHTDGRVARGTHRTWPQTEALKAYLAAYEHLQIDSRNMVRQALDNLLGLYLDRQPRGLWTDRLAEDGAPIVGPSPASTLYHFVQAFSELQRLEPLLSAGTPPDGEAR